MYRQYAENILTHPSLPPLIKGNSRLRQSSPSPGDWLWSPRHVLRWARLYLAGSSQPHALIQHPYPTRDVTFHVPLTSLGSWGSVCQCLHALQPPSTHCIWLLQWCRWLALQKGEHMFFLWALYGQTPWIQLSPLCIFPVPCSRVGPLWPYPRQGQLLPRSFTHRGFASGYFSPHH